MMHITFLTLSYAISKMRQVRVCILTLTLLFQDFLYPMFKLYLLQGLGVGQRMQETWVFSFLIYFQPFGKIGV